MTQPTEVLDASALLAWLQNELGAEKVQLDGSVMNSVNWSEVLQKAHQNGVVVAGLQGELEALGLRLAGFSVEEGQIAAELFRSTKPFGLSLGDRACLATAERLSGVAVTAEKIWSRLNRVQVRQIR